MCVIEDCDRPVHYRPEGWCKRHYQIWYRTGSPQLQPKPTVELRFWRKVSLGNDCWNWQKGLTQDGYGQFHLSIAKPIAAHRYAYELFMGTIPPGLEIDHLCRNRKCVNPDHLEPVPQRVNNERGVGVCAVNGRKTHCVHGHEFTPENTYWRPSGGRSCLLCKAATRARTYAETRR